MCYISKEKAFHFPQTTKVPVFWNHFIHRWQIKSIGKTSDQNKFSSKSTHLNKFTLEIKRKVKNHSYSYPFAFAFEGCRLEPKLSISSACTCGEAVWYLTNSIVNSPFPWKQKRQKINKHLWGGPFITVEDIHYCWGTPSVWWNDTDQYCGEFSVFENYSPILCIEHSIRESETQTS